MAESSRPRRSVGTQSYVHLLVIPPDLDDSSSSDDETGGKKDKGKQRAAPVSDADETDVSVYEEEAAPNKGKGKAKASSSSDDDEDGFEDAASSSSDSAPEEEEGSVPPATADRPTTTKLKTRKVGGASTPTTPKLAPRPVLALPRISTSNANSVSAPEPGTKRVQPPSSGLPEQLVVFGPHYEPPSRWLASGTSSTTTAPIVSGPAVTPDVRARFTEAWANLPFGPERSVLQDVGWWKGKWEDEGMTRRWGGWYPEVQLELAELDLVSESELEPAFLPRCMYPARPCKIYNDSALEPAELEAADDAMAVDKGRAGSVDGGEGEIEQTDVKIWVGSLAAGDSQEQISIERFGTRRLDDFFDSKPGHFFNAGAPVLGLAWCPQADTTLPATTEYLAVSTMSSAPALRHSPAAYPSLLQIWALDTSVPTDLERATSKEEKGRGMTFELGLCVGVGEAWSVQWCPKGGADSADGMDVDSDDNDAKLGIIAGAFTDGSISLFAVPDPVALRAQRKTKAAGPRYVRAEPLLRLSLENTSCFCFAWGSHETIAGGYSNGAVAIWSVGDALRQGFRTVRPAQYFPVHTAIIRSITFIRSPPLSPELDGSPDLDGEPTRIATIGYDGTANVVDLQDPNVPLEIWHERAAGTAIAFSSWMGTILSNDAENQVRASSLYPSEFGTSKKTTIHRSTVWSIAQSDHHPMVLSTSADGACTMANAVRALKKKSHGTHFAQKLYRIDFNRKLGEFRMIDNINAEQRATLEVLVKKRTGGTKAAPYEESVSSAAWSPEVGIFRAAWHPNLRQSCLAASGMACGLVRIDWVEREWCGKPAYGGDVRNGEVDDD